MKYKFFFIGLFLSFLIFTFYFNFETTGKFLLNTKENETLRLGYCPTMEKYANSIDSQNKNVDLLKFGDASTVMSKLNSKQIDVALIGRKAREDELGSNHERLLKPGFTLVSPSKYFIGYSELRNLEIITYEHKGITEIFPELNLEFIQDKADVFQGSNIVLISWEDYEDFMGLVIPLNEDGTKVEKFRAPIIYSGDGNLIETIKFNG